MKNLQEAFQKFSPIDKSLETRKNAIIYTRVSSKNQEDNTSLETQKKYCESFAISKGLNVVEYFGGTHESAKTDDRKEFNKMLAYVKKNKNIGFIIVYSYDRFSRTGANAANLTESLQKSGISVMAVTQYTETNTAAGKFQQSLFYMFSHFDNEQRRDKTKVGMKDLVRKGYWLWTPPIGYENKKVHSKAVDWDIQITEEGKHLQKAFKWRLNNEFSNAEIVRKLNRLGVNINERRLGEVFKNPFYCGILRSKLLQGEVFEGKHKPLISQKDFLRLNQIELTMHPKEHKNENENLPLRQFILCNECNKPLSGFEVKAKRIYYYKCRTNGCIGTKNANQLHEDFQKVLKQYELKPILIEVMKDVMTYVFSEVSKEDEADYKTIKTNLTQLKNKLDKIEERYAIGEISHEIYAKFSKQYTVEIDALNEILGSNGNTSSNLEFCINKALDFCKNISKHWGSMSFYENQKFLKLLFPRGLWYCKKNDRVQTSEVNVIFGLIHTLSGSLNVVKKGELVKNNQFSSLVTSLGFKPKTSTAVM